MSYQSNMYYVIKKNSNGEYLLNSKNKIVMESNDSNLCWIKFTDLIYNKNVKSDIFVICKKQVDSKYIQILCER